MSINRVLTVLAGIVFACLLAFAVTAAVPDKAEANIGNCTTSWDWHYGSSTYYYHSWHFRSQYRYNGNLYRTYNVYYYTWYSGYGWYLTDYTQATRRC